MSLWIEWPRGNEITSKRVEPGDPFMVCGSAGMLYMFGWAQVTIYDSSSTLFYDEFRIDQWGNWWSPESKPFIIDKRTQATIRAKITAAGVPGRTEVSNIGVGQNASKPSTPIDLTKLALIGSGVVIAGVLLAVMFRK